MRFFTRKEFGAFDFILALLHFLMLQRHSFKINHRCTRQRHVEGALEGVV